MKPNQPTMKLSEEQRQERISEVMRELGKLGGLATGRKDKQFRTERAKKAVNARWEKYRKQKEEAQVES